MLCTKSILTILAVAFLALNCIGQSASGPEYTNIICNESAIGLTFSLDTPLVYGTCKDANTPLVLPCPPGSGYINNGTQTGCVPWVLWSCTYKGGAPVCDSCQQSARFPNIQPDLYWSCQGLNTSQVLPCPDGTAFPPTGVNQTCQPWNVWSAGCPY